MSRLEKPILAGLGVAGMQTLVGDLGLPKFRAAQLADWVYHRLTLDPERMGNLPKDLKAALPDKTYCLSSRVAERCQSSDGTEKLLLELADGETIEMVMIPSPERMTFCLSTQVGCPVQCRFCASGAGGLVRNLEAGEILEEIYHGAAIIGRLPDNIVFMGIGEGLLNFDRLAAALEIMTSPDMLGISPRRLTVSTSGYVPGIHQLIALGKPFTLAVSLHAVDDETRAKIIPDHFRYPVAEILKACDEYRERIGRMITLEYTLLRDINDSEDAARRLAEIARAQHAKINLIPYNATDSQFERPSGNVIHRFKNILDSRGATVTLRMEKGAGADAACGQLRRRRLNPDGNN